MWLKQLKLGRVVFCGWLVILISAAVMLPRPVSNTIAYPILVLMLMWFLLLVVAHFLFPPSVAAGFGRAKRLGIYRMDQHRDAVCGCSCRWGRVVLCDTFITLCPVAADIIRLAVGQRSFLL